MQRHGDISAQLSFAAVTRDEQDELTRFIAADTYPFNAFPKPTREQVRGWLDAGFYTGTFWIAHRDAGRVGLLHYQDAKSITAELHIRLHAPFRGRGIGRCGIAWLVGHVFATYPGKHRVEGWTRVDNVPMRRVFRACGFRKEAHLRADFPTGTGGYTDNIGYALLRSEWQGETSVPVDWDDE